MSACQTNPSLSLDLRACLPLVEQHVPKKSQKRPIRVVAAEVAVPASASVSASVSANAVTARLIKDAASPVRSEFCSNQ